MRRSPRTVALTGAVVAIAAVASGCSFGGVNSISLPGNTSGDHTYRITVELPDAQNLVGNSPVKANNVTVGNVRGIRVDGWHARVLLDIDAERRLPANVTATLAQTSLFGSQYIELDVPSGVAPSGRLAAGAVLSRSSSDSYPPAEKVLSALSLVLNGSGLQQLRTITSQTDEVLSGNTADARRLVGRLRTFVDGLDSQKQDIENAIDSVAALGQTLSAQNATIARGIDTITPAIGVLNDQEKNLVAMLDSLGRFGDAATGVLDSSRADLVSVVRSLAPTLSSLAESGDNLAEALKIALTVPFPVTTVDKAIRGDYVNLFLTLDISPQKLGSAVLPSIVERRSAPPPTARQAVDPLRSPLAGRRGQVR